MRILLSLYFAVVFSAGCALFDYPDYGRSCQNDADCSQDYHCMDTADAGLRCQIIADDGGQRSDATSNDLTSNDVMNTVDAAQNNDAMHNNDAATGTDAQVDAGQTLDAGLNTDAHIVDSAIADDVGYQVLQYNDRSDAGVEDANYLAFGSALAFNEDAILTYPRLFVGIPNANNYIGEVAVFQRNNRTWEYSSTLAPGAMANSSAAFGSALTSADNKLVVAMPRQGTCGGIMTFRFIVNQWQNDDPVELAQEFCGMNHSFAATLTLNQTADILAVGQAQKHYNEELNGFDGAVYIYTWKVITSSWEQSQVLNPPTGFMDGSFGSSLAFSPDGQFLLIAAPGYSPAGSNGAGIALLYQLNQGTWAFQRALAAPETSAGDDGSSAIALDNTHAFIGTPGRNYDRGRIDRFTFSQTPSQRIILDEGSAQGRRLGSVLSLSANGNMLAAGGWNSDAHSSPLPVDLYVKGGGGSWSFLQRLTDPNNEVLDDFGSVVKLSNDGRTLAVGAAHNNIDEGPGRVYIFSY